MHHVVATWFLDDKVVIGLSRSRRYCSSVSRGIGYCSSVMNVALSIWGVTNRRNVLTGSGSLKVSAYMQLHVQLLSSGAEVVQACVKLSMHCRTYC